MSKVSTPGLPPQAPTSAGGQVSLNGNPIASAGFSNGSMFSNYDMNEYEKAIYTYSQQALANMLPQINTFSPEVMQSMQNQMNAYQNQGVNQINQMYTPMLDNLKNDMASRFGGFDNSIFMNNLNKIEQKRAESISSFAQDILARQSQLTNEEMSRRYGLAEFMASMQGLPLQNANSFLNTAMNGANSANSYNTNLYNTMYKQYMQNADAMKNMASIALAPVTGGTSLLGTML